MKLLYSQQSNGYTSIGFVTIYFVLWAVPSPSNLDCCVDNSTCVCSSLIGYLDYLNMPVDKHQNLESQGGLYVESNPGFILPCFLVTSF